VDTNTCRINSCNSTRNGHQKDPFFFKRREEHPKVLPWPCLHAANCPGCPYLNEKNIHCICRLLRIVEPEPVPGVNLAIDKCDIVDPGSTRKRQDATQHIRVPFVALTIATWYDVGNVERRADQSRALYLMLRPP
jgi:hypothetical protein